MRDDGKNEEDEGVYRSVCHEALLLVTAWNLSRFFNHEI